MPTKRATTELPMLSYKPGNWTLLLHLFLVIFLFVPLTQLLGWWPLTSFSILLWVKTFRNWLWISLESNSFSKHCTLTWYTRKGVPSSSCTSADILPASQNSKALNRQMWLVSYLLWARSHVLTLGSSTNRSLARLASFFVRNRQ